MTDSPKSDEFLTEAQRFRIERNREKALLLRSSQVVANDRDVFTTCKRIKISGASVGEGGFLTEDHIPVDSQIFEKDEEYSDNELDGGTRRRRRGKRCGPTGLSCRYDTDVANAADAVPLPPDKQKPCCDLCCREFEESFLRKNFCVDVCDRCRDPKGIHTLITKSTAKERYLLSEADLEVREPKLDFVLKRNPHNSCWGDMRLYLEAQVAERALSIWGSEENLEAERVRRIRQIESSKLKRYSKKIKELKIQTRSSLYMKTHKNHEHIFGEETYDAESDVYVKQCSECGHRATFEKL